MLGEEQRIINKHVLVKVFRICHTGVTEVDQVKMSDAKVTLAKIADKIINTYNTNEGWVVKKKRSKYANIVVAIWPIMYQKDKVQHFNNKFAMMISLKVY
jgi:hypothetical protein